MHSAFEKKLFAPKLGLHKKIDILTVSYNEII